MSTNITSRRGALALIGTALAIVAGTAASAQKMSAHSADRTAWDRAVAAELAKFDARVGFDDGLVAPDEIDDRYGELHEAHMEAFRTLIHTPAPDTKAVAHKIERCLANDRYGFVEGDTLDAFSILVADLQRLAGREG